MALPLDRDWGYVKRSNCARYNYKKSVYSVNPYSHYISIKLKVRFSKMVNKSVILCVDDEQTILESLKIELKQAFSDQYLIETAECSEEALELVEQLLEENYEVPVVISDYILPDIKGDELLKLIHAISPATVKVMLTGQADRETVENTLKHAKLYRYIKKPWQNEDLVFTVSEAIKSYFREKQLTDKNQELERKVTTFYKFVPVQFLKLFNIAGEFYDDSIDSDNDYQKTTFGIRRAFPVNRRFTLMTNANLFTFLRSTPPKYENFSIGGINYLAGYPEGDIGGKHALVLQMAGLLNPAGLTKLLPPDSNNVRLAGFIHAGNAWDTYQDINVQDLLYGGLGGLVWDTPFGSFFLGAGYTKGGRVNYYLSLGNLF